MGEALGADQPPDLGGVDREQADVGAGAAVTAPGNVQPLRWNIGRVHRHMVEGVSPKWATMANACR